MEFAARSMAATFAVKSSRNRSPLRDTRPRCSAQNKRTPITYNIIRQGLKLYVLTIRLTFAFLSTKSEAYVTRFENVFNISIIFFYFWSIIEHGTHYEQALFRLDNNFYFIFPMNWMDINYLSRRFKKEHVTKMHNLPESNKNGHIRSIRIWIVMILIYIDKNYFSKDLPILNWACVYHWLQSWKSNYLKLILWYEKVKIVQFLQQ